jgi:hypothetical protein
MVGEGNGAGTEPANLGAEDPFAGPDCPALPPPRYGVVEPWFLPPCPFTFRYISTFFMNSFDGNSNAFAKYSWSCRIGSMSWGTRKNSSWFSKSEVTTRNEPKVSSRKASRPLEYRILGPMTVARFPKSILLPVSASIWANEATHLRKTKRTSIVSRCDFGIIREIRCR